MADATAARGNDGPSQSSSMWLWGPQLDLLFGAGMLYFVVFGLFSVAGDAIRAAQPAYLLPLLVILVSMPHYGGTLLRVYESRQERRAYVFFSLWATLAIFALFVWGVHSLVIGSILVTVYLTWSPWHYTGQNYGIAVMFLRRRGVAIDALTKRWLYASFLLSYALLFVVFHAANDSAGAISFDRFAYERATVTFLSLSIPAWIAMPIAVGSVVAYAIATGVAVFRLLQRASLATLTPALALMMSQALWFSLPFGVRFFGVQTGLQPIDAQATIKDYVLWVALAHAAQYLWVTSYYAKASPRWSGQSKYWLKVMSCGIAIWTLPVILFAPGRLGSLAYDGGLSLVLAAAINIHHFVLDGAIWKLRHMRIGNVLILNAPESGGAPDSDAGDRGDWIRRAVWVGCGGATAAAFAGFLWMDVQFMPALRHGQLDRVGTLLERANWIGRDSPRNRRALGRRYFEAGNIELAEASYERSLELKPDSSNWGELGYIHQSQGDYDEAIAAYSAGLALSPDHTGLLMYLARAKLEVGEPSVAIATLEHLLTVTPDNEDARDLLERANEALTTDP
jgi:hypothetical protein